MSGLYDPVTGAFNVTVVDGSTYTGLYAPDGSLNVVVSDGNPGGVYHSCGALRVTLATSGSNQGRYAPDGSIYITELPFDPLQVQKVNVVSGTFHPGGGGGGHQTYFIYGF